MREPLTIDDTGQVRAVGTREPVFAVIELDGPGQWTAGSQDEANTVAREMVLASGGVWRTYRLVECDTFTPEDQ